MMKLMNLWKDLLWEDGWVSLILMMVVNIIAL